MMIYSSKVAQLSQSVSSQSLCTFNPKIVVRMVIVFSREYSTQLSAQRLRYLHAQDDLLRRMREAAERQLATISSQQGPYAKFIEALIVQVGSYFSYWTCFFALAPTNACLRSPPHLCFIEVLSLLFVMQWDGRASTEESAPEVDNWTTKHPCLRTTQHNTHLVSSWPSFFC